MAKKLGSSQFFLLVLYHFAFLFCSQLRIFIYVIVLATAKTNYVIRFLYGYIYILSLNNVQTNYVIFYL
jgi:hypothetical protein